MFWLWHGLRTSDDSFELRDQFKGFHELCEFDVLAEVLKASTSICLRDNVSSKDEVFYAVENVRVENLPLRLARLRIERIGREVGEDHQSGTLQLHVALEDELQHVRKAAPRAQTDPKLLGSIAKLLVDIPRQGHCRCPALLQFRLLLRALDEFLRDLLCANSGFF